MDKLFVDIREEHISIRKYFKYKDLISVEDLIEAIDNLIYEKENLEEKLDEIKNN